jgi:hypothetical protein
MTDDLAPTPAEREERTTLDAYFTAFTSEAGARVLLDLEKRFYVGRTTMTRPAPGLPVDPWETFGNERSRVVVLHIRAQIAKARHGFMPAPTHAVSSTATGEP